MPSEPPAVRSDARNFSRLSRGTRANQRCVLRSCRPAPLANGIGGHALQFALDGGHAAGRLLPPLQIFAPGDRLGQVGFLSARSTFRRSRIGGHFPPASAPRDSAPARRQAVPQGFRPARTELEIERELAWLRQEPHVTLDGIRTAAFFSASASPRHASGLSTLLQYSRTPSISRDWTTLSQTPVLTVTVGSGWVTQ